MNRSTNPQLSIQAVLVLYQRAPQESEAFNSLCHIFNTNADLEKAFNLLLYDNSPTPEAVTYPFTSWLHYHHDSENGGLVAAYSEGLIQAETKNLDWLMLLDQDTTLTENYLREALVTASEFSKEPSISAIVPRLMEARTITSPSTRLLVRDQAVPMNLTGVAPRKLSAFNSGAIVRCASIRAIGGFPAAFPVEALDHALFHLLQRHGGKLFIMQSRLQHKLSMNDISNSMTTDRYERVLAAEALFTRIYAGRWAHIRMHIRLLRLAIKQLLRPNETKFVPITLRYFWGRGC